MSTLVDQFRGRAAALASTRAATRTESGHAAFINNIAEALAEVAQPLTMRDLGALAEVAEAATHGYRLRWSVGDSVVADGVVRAFTREHGELIRPDDDVRDAYLWVSGTAEYFVPVRALIDLMAEDLAVVIR